MTLISILSLFIPLAWELFNDSRGDADKTTDVLVRIALAFTAALLNLFLISKPIVDSFVLSLAIHFMFFDYAISYILIKKGILEPPKGTVYKWFTYTAKVGVIDNLKFWREMNPMTKLYFRIGVLVAAISLYAISI